MDIKKSVKKASGMFLSPKKGFFHSLESLVEKIKVELFSLTLKIIKKAFLFFGNLILWG